MVSLFTKKGHYRIGFLYILQIFFGRPFYRTPPSSVDFTSLCLLHIPFPSQKIVPFAKKISGNNEYHAIGPLGIWIPSCYKIPEKLFVSIHLSICISYGLK